MAIIFPDGTQNFPGKVCQIQVARKVDQSAINANSGWTNIPNFSLSITPQNANNKILIFAGVNGSANTGSYVMSMRLYNGSSFIGDSTANGSRPATFQTYGAQPYSNYNRHTMTSCFLESGFSNTNQRTYTIYVYSPRDAGIICINRGAYDDNSGSVPVGVSYMIAYELEDS